MRIYYIVSLLILLFFTTAHSNAACDGTTTTLGSDCVHYQNTAHGSYLGLIATRGRACERAHQFLDDHLKTWAETNCINKDWRPDRDAGRRVCRNSDPLALATRGVRCLQGVNLAVTDPYNHASCQRTRNLYTAVRQPDGTIRMILNYSTRFPRPAEMLSPCSGDIFTAVQRCSFAVRDFYLPQTDCVCTNGTCELKERLNAQPTATSQAPAEAPATADEAGVVEINQ